MIEPFCPSIEENKNQTIKSNKWKMNEIHKAAFLKQKKTKKQDCTSKLLNVLILTISLIERKKM